MPAGGGASRTSWTPRRRARLAARRRRRSRCPSASCCSWASWRRTRARGCWCPRWPRPRTGLPLVVLGEGTLAHALQVRRRRRRRAAACCAAGREREDVLRALARATALVFPSLWPEPLSRVLLEALALGTPVAAMDTGGTREILRTARRPAGRATRRGWATRWRGWSATRRLRARRARGGARARAGLLARGPRAALRGRVPEARAEGRAAQPRPPIRCTAGRDGARGLPAGARTCRRGRETVLFTRPAHARRAPFPGEVVRCPTARCARRHGRVLDRTLRYPRFAAAPGRGGGASWCATGAVDVVDAQGLTALGYGRLRAGATPRCARRW